MTADQSRRVLLWETHNGGRSPANADQRKREPRFVGFLQWLEARLARPATPEVRSAL